MIPRLSRVAMVLPSRIALVALAGFAVASLGVENAGAQGIRKKHHHAATVYACSRYGRGCVSAPTRQGSVEMEVRLPGGTWIGCRQDCRETLREESVDFFETLRERRGDSFR